MRNVHQQKFEVINTGTSRDVFGDRYFTLWAKPDGGIKFNAPLKVCC